jgi:hypothetical protein
MKKLIEELKKNMFSSFPVSQILESSEYTTDKKLKSLTVSFVHSATVSHEIARKFIPVEFTWTVKQLSRGIIMQTFTAKL